MANLEDAVRERLEPSNEPACGRMGLGGAGQDQEERLRHDKRQGTSRRQTRPAAIQCDDSKTYTRQRKPAGCNYGTR
jgi:hypothetical protein